MFYHVSLQKETLEVGDVKLFTPRIPINGYLDETGKTIEDYITPRVCLSPTIFGCLVASNGCDSPASLYLDYISTISIFATNDIPNILRPRQVKKKVPDKYKGIVPDCHVTHEVWSLDPINLTLIHKYNWTTSLKDKAYRSFMISVWKDEYNRYMPKRYRI
jgi:hypothetical protein